MFLLLKHVSNTEMRLCFFQGMCFSMSVIVSGLNWIRGVCPSVCLLPVYRCEFAYCQCWSELCHRLWQSQQPRERVFGIFWMTGCWKIQFTWTFQLSERHTRVGINSFLALLIRLFFCFYFVIISNRLPFVECYFLLFFVFRVGTLLANDIFWRNHKKTLVSDLFVTVLRLSLRECLFVYVRLCLLSRMGAENCISNINLIELQHIKLINGIKSAKSV